MQGTRIRSMRTVRGVGSVGKRPFLVINQVVREGLTEMNWTRNHGRYWCYGLCALIHILTIPNNAPFSPGKIIYLQCCPASHNCENYFVQLKIAKIKMVFPFQDLCAFFITQPSRSVRDLIIQASRVNSPTWYTCQSRIFYELGLNMLIWFYVPMQI